MRYAEWSGTERLALPGAVLWLGAVRSGSAGEEPVAWCGVHGVV